MSKNMPRLGWLNPWLYKNPDMFNDVTKGVNTGGGSAGFAALAGWDPATGLGTPNFPKMLAAALKKHEDAIVV
jgi:tripeptidyl-peptidase-1